MTPEEVGRTLGVSRETLARLEAFSALLTKWQKAINLVAPASLPDLWRRHILDSGQLARLAPLDALWLDLGSGAGFPGLVLAILGAREVRLVESDARKCAFLREAARITSAPVTVVNARIEDIAPFAADVVTARALAPLAKLLGFAAPFLAPHSLALFPKGLDVEGELTQAYKNWRMKAERHPSLTDSRATILRLTEVEHV
jgi:16S rRNA (guanine527-N7)-methyltransferase